MDLSLTDEHNELIRELSVFGRLGVDEKIVVAAMGRWRRRPEILTHFRESFCDGMLSSLGEGSTEAKSNFFDFLNSESYRFTKLMFDWLMEPIERDARLAHTALQKGSLVILLEMAYTSPPFGLHEISQAYRLIFRRSLDEDITHKIVETHSHFFSLLISSNRCKDPHPFMTVVETDAQILHSAILERATKDPIGNNDVVEIFTMRSILTLRSIFKVYQENYGKSIQEDYVDVIYIIDAIEIISSPATYFSKVIHKSLEDGADENSVDGLIRGIILRPAVLMIDVKEVHLKQYGTNLEEDIKKATRGVYRDGLLSLL